MPDKPHQEVGLVLGDIFKDIDGMSQLHEVFRGCLWVNVTQSQEETPGRWWEWVPSGPFRRRQAVKGLLRLKSDVGYTLTKAKRNPPFLLYNLSNDFPGEES